MIAFISRRLMKPTVKAFSSEIFQSAEISYNFIIFLSFFAANLFVSYESNKSCLGNISFTFEFFATFSHVTTSQILEEKM